MSGWKSSVVSTALGLLGALVGYFNFTALLNIGDEDKFDWGGVLGALIGPVIVVALASWLIKRFAGRRAPTGTRAPNGAQVVLAAIGGAIGGGARYGVGRCEDLHGSQPEGAVAERTDCAIRSTPERPSAGRAR
jgi:uncharacterized membrane protein YeaQ/YmgE (transglycosylase-associated protein family)